MSTYSGQQLSPEALRSIMASGAIRPLFFQNMSASPCGCLTDTLLSSGLAAEGAERGAILAYCEENTERFRSVLETAGVAHGCDGAGSGSNTSGSVASAEKPWYQRPIAWIGAGVVGLGLVAWGLKR